MSRKLYNLNSHSEVVAGAIKEVLNQHDADDTAMIGVRLAAEKIAQRWKEKHVTFKPDKFLAACGFTSEVPPTVPTKKEVPSGTDTQPPA